MTSQTPAPTAAPQKKRGPLVIILVVVGVLVVAGAAIAAWKLSSSSSSKSGAPAGQTAKGLYKAWQSGNQAAAAKDATPSSVTAIFTGEADRRQRAPVRRVLRDGEQPLPQGVHLEPARRPSSR